MRVLRRRRGVRVRKRRTVSTPLPRPSTHREAHSLSGPPVPTQLQPWDPGTPSHPGAAVASLPSAHPLWPQVHEDYDCTLNQTNTGSNNNKFYIIQLLEEGDCFICWNRWGRVVGQSKLSRFMSLEDAQKDFEKKFRDKTKNSWAERDHFQVYTYEVQREDEAQEAMVKVKWPEREDVKKMPLGKLSKQQISRGLEALEAVEAALKAPADRGLSLEELSSHFYTIIPHNFGRSQPPPINSPELLQAKKDMLLVLADIELAQTLQAAPEETKKVEEVPHPLDRDYQLLKCQLQLLDPKAPEYKVIHPCLEKTGSKYSCPALQHSWTVNREGEGDQFQAHDKLGNRKLLGLRIMPHSGGRVGKGIYFASENSKSDGYVTGMSCGAHDIGYMFLGEVAVGREYRIAVYEPSLKQPPPGFDSVITRGHTEPVPTQDTKLELDGQRVVVPQGQPMPCPEFSSSSFFQSEYLIYQESQCRLCYLLEVMGVMDWHYYWDTDTAAYSSL
ncbi:hypothetical protein EI555_002135, partial [Monodon monoceros]